MPKYDPRFRDINYAILFLRERMPRLASGLAKVYHSEVITALEQAKIVHGRGAHFQVAFDLCSCGLILEGQQMHEAKGHLDAQGNPTSVIIYRPEMYAWDVACTDCASITVIQKPELANAEQLINHKSDCKGATNA